jgi:glycerol dehydrogenase
VGGGVLCDFAKLCGHFAQLPVLTIPTSSATCAAYTPMSIRYTPEGKTVGSLHFDHEVGGVIADLEILGKQPVRLLLAGVFDALAKFIEIKQRFTEATEDYPIGLNYAYTMAKASYGLLTGLTGKCIRDMEAGVISHDVENVIFTSIAATGVISGVARGSNQSALAHRFYETTRTLYPETAKPYLHGEIVGVGLLLQNHFNGEEANNAQLLELMKAHNMPCCIEDVGVERTEEMYQTYYEMLCASSAIETEEESVRLRGSLRYLWDLA